MNYFAYIRVSTVKQGEQGSSLQEQRDAIERFAGRNNFRISQWFEERETAAKTGRLEFTKLMSALKAKKAHGVIFHKIDRSARNLRDWSAVQDLADWGLDVRFAQESINLGSNEGKLTGDFLAVIAAHYIRNLREEVKKGIRGRLKQGLYPFNAYLGYLNQGGGKPKIPDPERAPFVQLAFELYANGCYSLKRLSDELYARGLRTKGGKRVTFKRLAEILHNPFYAGIIRLKGTGECFAGVHAPLINKRLFDDVQAVLAGKRSGTKVIVHDFLFRKLITCRDCGFRLVGERHDTSTYYRCHSRQCPGVSFREDVIQSIVEANLGQIVLDKTLVSSLQDLANSLQFDRRQILAREIAALDLQLAQIKDRQARLTNLYIDGAVDRALFEDRKLSLMMEQKDIETRSTKNASDICHLETRVVQYLEILKVASLSYKLGTHQQKRQLVQTLTSKFVASPKKLVFELKSPFKEIANLRPVRFGGPQRNEPRKLAEQIFHTINSYCENERNINEEERQRVALAEFAE